MVLRTLKADTENKAPTGLRRSRAEQQKRRRTRVEHAAKAAHKRTSLPKLVTTPRTSLDHMRHHHASASPSPSINDIEMADATAPATPTVPTTPIQLPRELRRPTFPPVSPQALRAVGEVTNAPFVRNALDQLGPRMLQVVRSVRVPCAPASQIPRELAVIVNDRAASAPTHMLAIHGPPPANGAPRKVQLLPAHSAVLAAHCARLPPFAPARENLISTVPAALALPVRAISLPVPAQFPLLLGYLYVRDADGLLRTLLPEPVPSLSEEEEAAEFPHAAYARAIGTKYTPSALIAHVGRVHGLWQNVCALGVSDDALWATMQLAWQVLLAAIAVATRAPERFGLGLERETRVSASPRPVCNGVSSHPITSS
ncbi:hypothetical protein EV121DRAFT_295709 [Schizophyllum commune]